ncbi:DsbA family protein [Rhizobium sp. Pop5]|uniref:DsbA family protein n=1 Tax=Rhizobium sp. Pop5 TaxID=1223565 RepID=UPI00055FAC5A|nr:DsbA family protein [Rhizobium sp. Pop5]UVD56826.1 DsbA family protein [Rhizobium sp. Pop5]
MSAVTVYTDYVCPFCLLAEQVLTDIGERFLRGTPPLDDLRQAMDQFGRFGIVAERHEHQAHALTSPTSNERT